MVEGGCDENLQRWYYDKEQEKCKKFTFNGCEGNENNFVTKKECRMQCDDFWIEKGIIRPDEE
ncbi:UNVERIFIED_CONTAM: Kunitz-type serine protease inhibitor bitisilin-2 [Trichonephila clavipes]